MAINSYSTLKTAISNWLANDQLTQYLGDFITLGEARIYRKLRIRCMEASLSSAISSGVVAVPTRYKEMKFCYLDGSPTHKLTRKTADWIYQNYFKRSSSGIPMFFAREAENFIFGPYPDSTYTMKGVYYQSLPALKDSNTTNWFTDNAPDILLFASLCEAEPFMKNDPRIALWESKYQAAETRIQRESDSEELSGSLLMASRG